MWFCVLVIACMSLHAVEGLTQTATACDGGWLILDCPASLNIISANYGRLDKTTCPGTYAIGSAQLNTVSCSAATSLSVVNSKCNGLLYCSVNAATAVFGDPCPTIAKYLTATYSCPGVTTTVAVGSWLFLECPGPMTIISANYGRIDKTTCPSGNAIGSAPLNNTTCIAAPSLSTVTSLCGGLMYCRVHPTDILVPYYDPCPGTAKYTTATYSCPTTTTTGVVCDDGSTMLLQCPTGLFLNIWNANCGRRDNFTCPSTYALGSVPLSNTTCTATNSLSVVYAACNGKTNCSVSVGMFGYDPCPGILKYLTVQYSCIGISTQVACENSTLTIQCASGVIVILATNFGRMDTTICGNCSVDHCMDCCSLGIINNTCNGKQNCSILATSATFGGDPCGGVPKYLSVTFYCSVATTSTTSTTSTTTTTTTLTPSTFSTSTSTTTPSTSSSTTSTSAPTTSLITTTPAITSTTTDFTSTFVATTSSSTAEPVGLPLSDTTTIVSNTEAAATKPSVNQTSHTSDWIMWALIATIALITATIITSCCCFSIASGFKKKRSKKHKHSQTYVAF